MNILKQDRRRLIVRKVHLEYLDQRIVPSSVHPALAGGADVAIAHASVSLNLRGEGTATADAQTKLQTRRENRIIRLEERREAAIERRDARLEKLAARRAAADRFSPAIIVRSPAAQAASATSSHQTATGSGSSAGGSSTAGSSTGTTLPTIPVITTPAPTSPTTPVTTTPVSTPPGGTTSTNPLPDNVAVALDTVYEEYETGALPTTTQPGQVEIQGTSVGVQLRASDSADFATILADAASLGLQVTASSAAFDTVVGFLPIANLPAAAQLPGTPSITPVLYPTLNSGGPGYS